MTSPIIGLLLGIIVVFFGTYSYQGKSKFLPNLLIISKKNNLFLLGLITVAIALMLGIIGYIFSLAHSFRYLRLGILLVGLILIKLSVAKRFEQLPKLPKIIEYFITLNSTQFLQILSGIIISFLFLKSIVAVDWTGGDSWMYHLPFAARFWGMITPEEYLFEAEREPFYNTTTMLPNILQGFFWYLFGLQRPQGANLVSFFSLIGYFAFLKSYLKIPFYLSILTILAVPLIHIATTACYVDLLGNVGLSITIMMTFLLYTKDNFITPKNILIFILGGFIAANTKYLLVPPLTIVLFFVTLRILWLIIIEKRDKNIKNVIKNIALFLGIGSVSSIVIFATEFKNIILYQNPFYPLKVSIFGHVLNHLIVPSSDYMSKYLQAMPPIQRWVLSLLEIGAFDEKRPWLWTIAMDYVPLDDDSFGIGGYFAIYVIFNLILFGFLCTNWNREIKVALSIVITMTIITPFLPFSYQLRYYMFWIMVLISFNLYLLLNQPKLLTKYSFLKPNNFGYIGLVIMITFAVLTNWDYTYPDAVSLSKFMKDHDRVDMTILNGIKPGEEVCLVGFSPLSFLYNPKFHTDRDYSIKSEFLISPEYIKEKCGDRRIIYKNKS